MSHTKIFLGDCLDVLHGLDEKFQLIYLDPPFNTGVSRSYKDKWETTEAYISYLRYRLLALNRVLDGSIVVHCDHNMSHHIRVVMESIFPVFVNEIVWHYGLGGFRTKKRLPRKHDNLLWYASKKDHTFNSIRLEPTKSMLSKYCHIEEDGRRYMMSYGKKYYMKGGKPLDDVWNDIQSLSPTAKERNGYETQKPLALLERIIKLTTNEGDSILDPFCGSGTTVEAASRLNRNSIGIDLSEDAICKTRSRMSL